MNNYIIKIKEVSKNYKKNLAIERLSINIEKGQVYGLLGKNGAGKSTLIKMIIGLIKASKGEVEIFGEVPICGNHKIAYLPEDIALYPHLTTKDHIVMTYRLLNKKYSPQDIVETCHKVGLEKAINKPTKDFSLGMKRRLQLGIVLMQEDCELWIFDEPTNGLDAQGVLWLRGYIEGLTRKGKTVLIASHSIKELEEIITRYIILDKGKVVKSDSWNKDTNEKSLEKIFIDFIDNEGKENCGIYS